jgi:recombination protein RecR
MRIPRPLQRVIESFEKLPGIGPKSAQRLSYYLLHVPQEQLEGFAESLSELKKLTVLCSVCKNVSDQDPCPVCSDTSRDQSVIMVVEQPMDVLAVERSGRFTGVYHVLHGAINPMENIGPDEIFIAALLARILTPDSLVKELIIATNPTMEGEATAMDINNNLKSKNSNVSVTRLGVGIPTGADLEYADDMTLRQAIDGRRTM